MSNVEAKLITYLPYRDIEEDIHIVKEVRFEDGKYSDNIRVIKDYKRPFWVTKEAYRNHKDKKEAEDINKCALHWSTESKLRFNIPKYLGERYIGVNDLRIIRDSPYLYGIDIQARTYLKRRYMKESNFATSPYRLGVFDIEVSIKTDRLLVASIVTPEKAHVYVVRELIENVDNPIEMIKEKYREHIPENNFNVSLEIKIFEDELACIRAIFKEANYLPIDYLLIWNIAYDIPKILSILKRYEVDPVDIFHYDEIPRKYGFFRYNEGMKQKTTASGKFIPINIEDQWHTVTSTTNYAFMDAMSAYKHVRTGGKAVPGGYSLNNILEFENIPGKLKFDDIDDSIQDVEWHNYMVKNKPIEYIIYNIWDSLSILALNEKTKDYSVNVPLLLGVSHLDIFNSSTKRIVDALNFFYLENKKVLGTKPTHNEEGKLLNLSDWIVTLPSFLLENNGLKNIEEDPTISNAIRLFIYDADAVSSYPSNTIAVNLSKDTTHRELSDIEGVPLTEIKSQGINLMFGKTNVSEYNQKMFKTPSHFELLKRIKKRLR